jgi:hypothetical protein
MTSFIENESLTVSCTTRQLGLAKANEYMFDSDLFHFKRAIFKTFLGVIAY